MQATAIAHPNVALIKYWGKEHIDSNLPAVGSLSLTLGGLNTRTRISFSPELTADEVLLNGAVDERASQGVSRCLGLLREHAGKDMYARVESENDFPTSAGLASSASGYAALVTAACAALGLDLPQAERDLITRIGSGSAPRSLYDGIVLLEKTDDPTGMDCRSIAAPGDWPLQVVVAVTTRQQKAVSSTGGMESSRETSPCYQSWVDTHRADLDTALESLRNRDFEKLAVVSEHSCLKMHAVAMSSQPALVYWSAATAECMQVVRSLRKSGVPVFFTIDAGPQLKAVCLPDATTAVREALADVPGVMDLLECHLGRGAQVVND
ncbi:MAG: diphosphomevalonate decarboxylase [Gammaproteobacteria bacterium]